jgi:hypothetical protein
LLRDSARDVARPAVADFAHADQVVALLVGFVNPSGVAALHLGKSARCTRFIFNQASLRAGAVWCVGLLAIESQPRLSKLAA